MSETGDRSENEPMTRAKKGGKHRRPSFLQATFLFWVGALKIGSRGELGGIVLKK